MGRIEVLALKLDLLCLRPLHLTATPYHKAEAGQELPAQMFCALFSEAAVDSTPGLEAETPCPGQRECEASVKLFQTYPRFGRGAYSVQGGAYFRNCGFSLGRVFQLSTL